MLEKNLDIAINELLNAVQIKDDDVDLLFTLAALLTDNGETNHAAEYYEKIIKLEPQNKEALKNLRLSVKVSEITKCRQNILKKIVEADSKDLDALKTLARAYERTKSNKKSN